MNPFHRLHNLRMENDQAGYAMAELKPRFDQLAGRHENGTAPRAVSAFNLFQTPPELAARMVALLDLKPGCRVLEPSAGLGRLLDALTPLPAETVAVEIATQCAQELYRQDRDRTIIKQRDFLTVTPDKIGLFDCVIMNPPFHLRADIKHIRHACNFVKTGGKLVALCLDTHHRREAFAHADQWIDIDAGMFGKDGTNVKTAIVVMEKSL